MTISRKKRAKKASVNTLLWRSAGALSAIALVLLVARQQQQQALHSEQPAPARQQVTASISPTIEPLEPHGLSANYLSGRYAATIADFGNASKFLNDALQLDSSNGEMTGYAYRMRLVANDMEGAAHLAKKLYTKQDRDSNPEIMVLLSQVKKQDITHAKETLSHFEAGGFNLIVVPLFTQWLQLASGELKAPVQFDDTVQKAPEFLPFIAYQTALINDAAGFKDMAEKQYEIALEAAHSMPFRVVEMLGNLYAREGKWEKLATLHTRFQSDFADADDPLAPPLPEKGVTPKPLISSASEGIAEILFSTASILKGEGLNEEALIYTQQALYLHPKFAAARLMRGSIFEALERPQEAIASYDALPKDSPYFLRGQLRKAYVLSDMEQIDSALSVLKSLARNKELTYQLSLTQGDILMREKRFTEAEDAYDTALKAAGRTHDSQWPVYYARGISRERQSEWKGAEADLLKALDMEPGQPDVLNYLGYSWLTQNRHIDRAKGMIEQAVKARPTDGHIVDSMGWAFFLLEDYANAKDYMERAIELMPNDPTVNDHLGDVYWRLGRKTEARYQWKRALLGKPEADLAQALEKKLTTGLPESAAKIKTGSSLANKDQRAELP